MNMKFEFIFIGTDVQRMEKTRYRTKQGDLIVQYLKDNPGKHLTVEQVAQHFRQIGQPVGLSTVYRHLEKLTDEGALAKYDAPAGGSACYVYEQHDDISAHYHLICDDCGKLMHIECGYLDDLFAHVQGQHSFALDRYKTVLHGRCGTCMTKR